MMMANPCEKLYTDATCKADATCEWKGNKCDANGATPAMLKVMCGDCLMKMLTGPVAKTMGGTDSVLAARNAYCIKSATGEYCMTTLTDAKFDPSKMENATDATLDAVCKVSTVKECSIKVLSAMGPMMSSEIQSSFDSCLKNQYWNPNTRMMEKADPQMCYREFMERQRELRRSVGFVSSMCQKNTAGKYCFVLVAEVSNANTTTARTSMKSVFDTATPACDATCDAYWKGVYDNFGCCMGMVQEMMFAPGPTPAAPRNVPAGTTLTTDAPPPTVAAANFKKTPADGEVELKVVQIPKGSLIELKACASLASVIEQQLTVTCGTKVAPIQKSMPLRLSFKKLNEDPVLKEKIKTAMRSDVAAAIGVASTDIQNDKIVENTAVAIKTASRRMQTLATESGATYQFEIVTNDPAVATSASSSFDKKASTGDITLPSTATVATTECTGCVSSTQSGNTAATLTEAQSSARAVGVSVAAVAAALLAIVM
jgi:hypothetical protein